MQSVLYHQKFSCKSDFMFLVILRWYFWYLVQMCLILHCKFVYAAARVSTYFFILWFLCFHFQRSCSRLRVTLSMHFVFLLMFWGAVAFGFLFAIYNLQSHFWYKKQHHNKQKINPTQKAQQEQKHLINIMINMHTHKTRSLRYTQAWPKWSWR